LILSTQAAIFISILDLSVIIPENKLLNFLSIIFGTVDETVCSIHPYGYLAKLVTIFSIPSNLLFEKLSSIVDLSKSIFSGKSIYNQVFCSCSTLAILIILVINNGDSLK